jgi:type IV secretory pathway VirB10-like protein
MDPAVNGNGATEANGTSRMTPEEALLSFGPRPAVTRVSPRAVLAIAGAAAGLGLVVVVLGLGGRPPPARQTTAAEESVVRASGPVEPVRELPSDYAFAAPGDRPAGAAGTTQPASDATPEQQAAADTRRRLTEFSRKLAEEQGKEQTAAFDSPLVFGVHSTVHASVAAAADSSPTTEAVGLVTPGRPPVPGIEALLAAAPGGQQQAATATAGGQPPEKAAFLTAAAAVEPYLRKPLVSPVSPYELKAGTVIPGALVTGVNTDLPGDVIGQVTENVYDSATGHYLLVPQGSRLLGRYQALVGNGQNRALLAWQRLVYPDGRSIELEAMPGTDAAGAAGLADRVDYHLDKLAAATALSTAIAYGGNLARNRSAGVGGGYGNEDVIGDTVAQQADRVGSRIIDRQLDVQPTITVRPGWPFRVLVNKDIVLAPYGDPDADDRSPHHQP